MRPDAAENGLVRHAVTVDTALLPEIVHAEIGHDADQRRSHLASLLQIGSHGSGNHLRADDHVRREAPDGRLQAADQPHPAPLHHHQPRAHAVARETVGVVSQRGVQQREQHPVGRVLGGASRGHADIGCDCGNQFQDFEHRGRRPGFALQNLTPGMFVERVQPLVQLRIVLHETEVGLVHGLRDARVHQRPQVERVHGGRAGQRRFDSHFDRLSRTHMAEAQP
jgi:hypothetical protein